jgi:hypothetical protein
MASDVQARSGTSPKYAAFIDDNLAQVQSKIRLADLGRGILGLAAIVFGYLLAAALFDHLTGGGSSTTILAIRLGLFATFFLVLAVFGFRTMSRYLTRVNPYYAARQLEETIPDAKNSLINWLDLKNQTLPPAIYNAVGLKAAKDMKQADPELAVSSRDLWKVATIAGVFLIGLVLMFFMLPRQFGSLMARAATPFRDLKVTPPTVITMIKPAGGDATVPANHHVYFVAQIEGRVPEPNTPDAPALHFRNTPNDVYVRVPLEEDTTGQWHAKLSPDQVRTGLWYKVTAGNATTKEHRLTVRSQPFVTQFTVTYKYRPYRKVADETVIFPNETAHQPRIYAHRGTAVTLRIRANTPIKAGSLMLAVDGKLAGVKGEAADDPNALVFRLTLEKSGQFQVLFEAADGEKNLDQSAYDLHVLDDGAPTVEILVPGKDVTAPVGGTVLLGGVAFDDFGVTGLSLHLNVLDKQSKRPLAPIPYRPGKSFQFKNGAYPTAVEYVETLMLDRLLDTSKKPAVLAAGNEIEYWLEATDNYDYPKPNVGKSRVYKIKLTEPDKTPEQQKKERDKAEQKRDQMQKKQDDNHQKQDQKNEQSKDESNKGDKKQENAGQSPKSGNEQDQMQDQKQQMEKVAEKLNKEMAKNDSSSGSGQNPDTKKNDSGQNPNGGESGNEKSKNPMNPMDKNNTPESSSNKGGPTSSNDKKDAKGEGKETTPKAGEKGGDEPANKKSPAQQKQGKGGDKAVGSEPDSKSGDTKQKAGGEAEKGNGPAKTAASTDKKAIEKVEGKTSDSAKTEKTTGPPDNKSNPGVAKGNEPNAKDGPKSDSKKGPESGKSEPKVGKGPNDNNDGKGKQGQAKDDAAMAKGTGNKNDRRDPTKEDVDKLKDLFDKSDPSADEAAKDLAQRGRDMKDADLKKALEDLLREKGHDKDAQTLSGEEKLPPPQSADAGTDSKQGPPNNGKDSSLEKTTTPGGGGTKEGAGKDATAQTSGGGGFEDQLQTITPDEIFRRRLGNLQIDNIEDLKKRVTKDVLDKAGVSPAEWQQFLKNAQEYNRLMEQNRRTPRAEPKTLSGRASQIAPVGPRTIETAPGARFDPLAGGQTTVPPEFQDAQDAFTRPKR